MKSSTVKTFQTRGFTLLEMLLVLAISSSLILLMINFTTQKADQLRRDKTAFQMQQILNAALSYYINNSAWPTASGVSCGSASWRNLTALNNFFPGYLPTNFTANAYGNSFFVNCADPSTTAANGANFYIATTIDKSSNALIIAGTLPMAFTTTDIPSTAPPVTQAAICNTTPYDPTCTSVVTSVNVPGQNLNNARSINFMGLYYSGSCVPAPTCPAGMTASIIVSAAGVSGVYDAPSCSDVSPWDATTCSTVKVYPISSFYAFARGGNLTSGTPAAPASVLSCSGGSTETCTTYSSGSRSGTAFATATDLASQYWRVCISVMTSKGVVTPPAATAGNFAIQQGKIMGQIAAFTRCVPNNGTETPSGSFNTFNY